MRQCLEAGLDAAELKGKTRKELSACLNVQTRDEMETAAEAETRADTVKAKPGSESTGGNSEKAEPSSENAKPARRRGDAEGVIRAYQAAHPRATRNEAARATGYTWATVNKYWV